jgi:hypothetical protein
MIYRPTWDGFSPALDAVAETIGRIASICRRRRIGLSVVVIPDEIQIDPRLQRELAAADPRYALKGMKYRLPNRKLGERLELLGIDTLDLLPAFREAARAKRLYRPRDTHWNIAGNAFAAELIARHLVNCGSINGAPGP